MYSNFEVSSVKLFYRFASAVSKLNKIFFLRTWIKPKIAGISSFTAFRTRKLMFPSTFQTMFDQFQCEIFVHVTLPMTIEQLSSQWIDRRLFVSKYSQFTMLLWSLSNQNATLNTSIYISKESYILITEFVLQITEIISHDHNSIWTSFQQIINGS